MLLLSLDLGGKVGGPGSSSLDDVSVSNGPLIRSSEWVADARPFGTGSN